MCGIAGIVHMDGSAVDERQLGNLTDALRHRGPDACGTFIDGSIGLGHRRLSIIDLSEGGAQPMRSQDGRFTLVFNGEIYNFQEQRERLERMGRRFRSKSDTEVLLMLYAEYGKGCLKYLRGMFAFAVFDAKERTVFLARDRIGKKPLKYFIRGQTIAFASELKALKVLPECPQGIDFEAVHHFLTMMAAPSPSTGSKSIKKLPAGHCMTINLKTMSHVIERYWSLSCVPDERPTEEEWCERILRTLKESVALRMISDVPLGAFLSGGVDSAAIVALMSGLSDRKVKTFSIGSTDPAFNELPDAERIATAFSTDHHPILLNADIVHLLPELVRTYEEPFADPSSIPTFLLAQETRKDVTVALNGDGGDENFLGYVRYPILRFSDKWHRAPTILHSLVKKGADLFHHIHQTTFSYRCQRFQASMHLPFPERYLQYISFFTEEEKRGLYREGFGTAFPRSDQQYAARTLDARALAHETVRQAQLMDLETYLADDLMPKVDLGTMAHGLEARSPFLDHELLELTAQIPTRFLLRNGHRKWILKRMLRGIVPDETIGPRKKRGFRLPLDVWFRTDLKSFVSDRLLLAPHLFYEIFDRAKLERFLHVYQESHIDYSDHIWALLWLSEWMKQYH